MTLHGTPRYLHAPAFVSSALKRSLVHEEGVHSTLDLWDRAKVALVGIGAYPKPDSSLVAVGFSDGDPAIADATGDVVGRFFTDDGTLIHYPDEPRLLGITPDRCGASRTWSGSPSVPTRPGRSSAWARAGQHPGHRRRDGPRGGRPARRIGRSTTVGHLAPRSPASSMPPRHGSGSSVACQLAANGADSKDENRAVIVIGPTVPIPRLQ